MVSSATDSRAGVQPGGPASSFCSITPGTSFCLGSFDGFRQDPDPNAYAGFGTNTNDFSAELGGQNYSCTVSSTLYPEVLATWPQMSTFRTGFFYIGWDPQGYCSSLQLFNGSEY
jgi:hypothetical protein